MVARGRDVGMILWPASASLELDEVVDAREADALLAGCDLDRALLDLAIRCVAVVVEVELAQLGVELQERERRPAPKPVGADVGCGAASVVVDCAEFSEHLGYRIEPTGDVETP